MKIFYSIVTLLMITSLTTAQSVLSDSLVEVAIGWRNRGNAELAIRQLDELTSSKNASVRAYYELAYTHLMLGNYTLAISPAQKVLRGSYRTDAALVLVQSYTHRGEYRRAERLINSLGVEAKSDVRIPYHHAELLLKMGRLDDAESLIHQAIVVDRGFEDAHLMLSAIMTGKGERLKAMLPLYYYLLIQNEGEGARQAVKQLIHLWNFSSGRVLERVSTKSKTAASRRDDVALYHISPNDTIMTLDGSVAINQLAEYTNQLFQYLSKSDERPLDVYQLVYVDLFSELHLTGHTNAFCWYICNPQWHPQVLEWIAGNNHSFNTFRLWMELR